MQSVAASSREIHNIFYKRDNDLFERLIAPLPSVVIIKCLYNSIIRPRTSRILYQIYMCCTLDRVVNFILGTFARFCRCEKIPPLILFGISQRYQYWYNTCTNLRTLTMYMYKVTLTGTYSLLQVLVRELLLVPVVLANDYKYRDGNM